MMRTLKQILAARRLKASLRPDPDFWERRLRSLSPERRERVLANKVLP